MAVYFLRSKHVSRSNGSRVTRAAAYRAGERIRNEATNELFDYSTRTDVSHKEVVVPADLDGREDMAWTQDRATLWNAAEHAGLRRNSRLAREWLVFLPPELNPDQRRHLVQEFAHELADSYRAAVDVCVHQPRPGADPRNFHAHLLMTMREVTPDGFGRRTSLEISGRQRYEMGIPGTSKAEYLNIRARWAVLTNQALERAGLSERIDHRSNKSRGIDREPTVSIPEKVWYAEHAGRSSAAGNEIRARHRERLEARKIGPEALRAVLEKQRSELKAGVERDRQQSLPKKVRFGSLTREERNAYRREYARESYRKRRALEATNPDAAEKRRAAGRRSYHLRKQKNPEVIREAQRHYRAENSAEVNRKQREYRHKIAETLNARRRAQRQEKAVERQRVASPSTASHPKDGSKAAALRWKAYRAQQGPEGTPLESALRWKAYRAKQGPDGTAAESALRWKKFREEQRQLETSTQGQHKGRESMDLDSLDQKRTHQRERDHDLER